MITLNVAEQGETITFFSEPDSRTPRAVAEVRLAPGAGGPPPHIHTRQREIFRITSGRLVATIDGQQLVADAGETLLVEPGQVHTFANGSETEIVVFRGEIEPPLHFQWTLTELAKSAIRTGGNWRKIPLLEVAYILNQVRDEYRVAGMPFWMQDIIFGVLARVAVLLGKSHKIGRKNERAANRLASRQPVT